MRGMIGEDMMIEGATSRPKEIAKEITVTVLDTLQWMNLGVSRIITIEVEMNRVNNTGVDLHQGEKEAKTEVSLQLGLEEVVRPFMCPKREPMPF